MSKRFRFFLILAVALVCGSFIFPTINWYFFVGQEEQQIAQSSREQIKEYATARSKEDLESLKTILSQNENSELPVAFSYLIDASRTRYETDNRDVPPSWTIKTVFNGFASRDRGVSERSILSVIEDHYRDHYLGLKATKRSILQLGLDLQGGMSIVLAPDFTELEARRTAEGQTLTEADRQEAVGRAIEILTSRIDRFGVAEPQMQRQTGGYDIFIEIPGDNDPERVNAFLRGRGSLSFNIVDDETEGQIRTRYGEDFDKMESLVIPQSELPAGRIVRSFYRKDRYGIDQFVNRRVLFTDEKNSLDGAYIIEARTDRDTISNQPLVLFTMTPEGASLFAKLTESNVKKTMAVIMDDKIKAGATIQEIIPTGRVQMSGFDQKEAGELAVVLRTGSLPVNLTVKSLQAIGPTLGADSISAGINSSAVGIILIIIFMLIYYKSSGVNADLALLINIFMMVSILSVFNLTLTLTSIAGLVLSVGMAVDANVIIFERIKEEWWAGKSRSTAVDAGFKKAFWTIMDSNLTTLIAAVFLSQLGKGPIQGFAITLAVGIVSSMFTALFVSKLLFDFSSDVFKTKGLGISWRKPV